MKKPYIAEILEHNGKTCLLPMPAKYRELLDCSNTLGLKDAEDEDDIRIVGYKALYVPEPDSGEIESCVSMIADELYKLSDQSL